MNRKRGAQPGNFNAYKHGFHSSRLKVAERGTPGRGSPSDLSEAVQLMRIAIRGFVRAQPGLPETLDFELQLSALRAIALSLASINRIVRAQYILAHAGQSGDLRSLAELLASPSDPPGEPDSRA